MAARWDRRAARSRRNPARRARLPRALAAAPGLTRWPKPPPCSFPTPAAAYFLPSHCPALRVQTKELTRFVLLGERGTRVVPSPCTTGRPERGPGPAARRGELIVRESPRKPASLVPGCVCPGSSFYFPRGARSLRGKLVAKFLNEVWALARGGLVRAPKARTEALLVASLFCFRGQTWSGVVGRVGDCQPRHSGPSRASLLPAPSFRHLPHPYLHLNPGTAPKATSLLPLSKPIISKLHHPTEVPRLGWRKRVGATVRSGVPPGG